MLEHTQKSEPGITAWQVWFLNCMSGTIEGFEGKLTT